MTARRARAGAAFILLALGGRPPASAETYPAQSDPRWSCRSRPADQPT